MLALSYSLLSSRKVCLYGDVRLGPAPRLGLTTLQFFMGLTTLQFFVGLTTLQFFVGLTTLQFFMGLTTLQFFMGLTTLQFFVGLTTLQFFVGLTTLQFFVGLTTLQFFVGLTTLQFGSPYPGKAQQPQEQRYPFLTSVCRIFVSKQRSICLPVLGIFNVRTDADADRRAVGTP